MSKVKEKLAKRVEQIEDVDVCEVNHPEVEVVCEDKPGNVVSIRNPEERSAVDIVPAFAITMSEAKERIRLLQTFVQELMIEGVDYGLIPGCKKPSLLKPGAEKLAEIYGFQKLVKVTNRTEDWDKPFVHYEITVQLINKRTGLIEAEGVGNCNSRERKYINQDTFTIANTILKMAKKRALVDAVLSATRSSGLFTQDIEEMDIEHRATTVKPSSPPTASIATSNQVRKINQLIKEVKLSAVDLKKMLLSFNVAVVDELSKADASTVIQQLMTK